MDNKPLSNTEVRQLAKRSKKEEYENNFYCHWVMMYGNLPEPVRQHPILNPKTNRHWKLDFAWPDWKIFVELQGGAFIRGGHTTALGQHADYERQNALTRMGWRGLYFNTVALRNMADVVEYVAEFLCNAKEVANGRSGEEG